ncbi:MAG: sulfite exporter TauE/SafE family protein [Gemmataceae bacterium]
MSVLAFTSLIALGALAAGFLGALTGLGGGVVIVPMLVLMGVDIHYAIGASLVSVIATSSGAAASYVKEGLSNIRIGMLLEIATTIGALTGAYLSKILQPEALSIIFGFVLLFSAYLSLRSRRPRFEAEKADPLAVRLRLDSTYPTAEGRQPYHVHGVPLGFALMYVAGCLSGLLGIGSGALKVLSMDYAMRIPFKVSTTTSNFMIGVTAAASAGIYLHSGYIVPGLAMPVMLGVLTGSLFGARVLMSAKPRILRRVFSVVILVLAIQMIYKGCTGKL